MTWPQEPDMAVAGPSRPAIPHLDLIPSASQQARERFFPPPFRIDKTDEDDIVGSSAVPAQKAIGHPATPHHLPPVLSTAVRSIFPHQPQRPSPLRPPVKKKRRLLFCSELPPPEAVNADGTPSVDHIRYKSTMRLKLKWDDICKRFKDAHLTQQDELYLGFGKEKMRVIKDNGVMRSWPEELTFGNFHIKDEDLDEVAKELKRAAGEDVDAEVLTGDETKRKRDKGMSTLDSDEDELGLWDEEFLRSQYREFTAAPETCTGEEESSEEEEEEPDPATMDPDLRDFLQEEAHRKELMADQDQSDDEGSIFDFAEERWDRRRGGTTTDSSGEDEENDEEETDDYGLKGCREDSAAQARLYLSHAGQYESSDDEMDVLDQEEGVLALQEEGAVVKERRGHWFPHGDWNTENGQGGVMEPPDEFAQMMYQARSNIEDLLSSHAQGCIPMPHDEVPALASIFDLARLALEDGSAQFDPSSTMAVAPSKRSRSVSVDVTTMPETACSPPASICQVSSAADIELVCCSFPPTAASEEAVQTGRGDSCQEDGDCTIASVSGPIRTFPITPPLKWKAFSSDSTTVSSRGAIDQQQQPKKKLCRSPLPSPSPPFAAAPPSSVSTITNTTTLCSPRKSFVRAFHPSPGGQDDGGDTWASVDPFLDVTGASPGTKSAGTTAAC